MNDISSLTIEEMQIDRETSETELKWCETSLLFMRAARGMTSDDDDIIAKLEERIRGNLEIIRVIDAELERRAK